MGAEEMQAVCMEFQKEMMKNELMGQVIDEITFGEEEELVDEEVAKVLREVAGEETASKGFGLRLTSRSCSCWSWWYSAGHWHGSAYELPAYCSQLNLFKCSYILKVVLLLFVFLIVSWCMLTNTANS